MVTTHRVSWPLTDAQYHERQIASRVITRRRRPGCFCDADPCPHGARHPNQLLVTGPACKADLVRHAR